MQSKSTTKTIRISDDIRTLSNEDLWAALRKADQPERTDWRALPAYKPAVGRGLSQLQQDMERMARFWEARR